MQPACAWTTPEPLDINTTEHDWGMWMSNDRREIIFASGIGATFDLYRATRSDGVGAFGARASLLATGAHEDDPFVDRDGQLWFTDTAAGNFDIKTAPFTNPTASTPVLGLSMNTVAETTPQLTGDGLAVYFSVSPFSTSQAIYRAQRATKLDAWGPPQIVPELSSASYTCCPAIADDGFMLFIEGNVITEPTRVMATRVTGDVIATPVPFAPVSNMQEIDDVFITSDGQTILYGIVTATQVTDIFISTCN